MQLRPYQKGDENEIFALDRKLETHPWNRRELDNWYWKYTDQNPQGRSFIWLIEQDGKILAHFAAVPYRLKVFSEELKASHSIAAMVTPEYQNRGLLKFVGDKLFEELHHNNIPFTYGFPNKLSYDLHKTFMNYEDLYFFDTWKTKEICRDSQGSDVLSFKAIGKFTEEFDALWQSCKDEYKIAVVRDKSYLNWRYLQRPDGKYYPFGIYRQNVLSGYVVLKLYHDDRIQKGHILDIFARPDDKEVLSKAVDVSMDFFDEQKVDEVTCWICGNGLIEDVFKEKIFFQESTHVPLVIRVDEEFDHSGPLKDSSNWYFTMGDSTEIF